MSGWLPNMVSPLIDVQREPTVHGCGGAPCGPRVGWMPADTIAPTWALASALSSGLSAYHGYLRNRSIGWAVGWGLAGALFPIITPAIALAQGFGRRA